MGIAESRKQKNQTENSCLKCLLSDVPDLLERICLSWFPLIPTDLPNHICYLWLEAPLLSHSQLHAQKNISNTSASANISQKSMIYLQSYFLEGSLSFIYHRTREWYVCDWAMTNYSFSSRICSIFTHREDRRLRLHALYDCKSLELDRYEGADHRSSGMAKTRDVIWCSYFPIRLIHSSLIIFFADCTFLTTEIWEVTYKYAQQRNGVRWPTDETI
jgi:hypothetical protein